MPRGRSPEEFFEVFREVQTNKKKQDGEPEEPAQPERDARRDEAASPRPARDPGRSVLAGPPLTVSRTTVAVGAAALALVLLATYLIGRQQGWRAYIAARRQAAAKQEAEPTQKAKGAPAAPSRTEPEFVDGKLFTLLVSGKRAEHRKSVEQEVAYLNDYAPFKALVIRAYAYTDRSGSHRVCATGLGALTQAEREHVKQSVRRLKSRRGQREYSGADFYPP